MAKKIKLEILGLSSSQSQSGSFALVLGEVEGNRRLPIIIGMFEAQAIAIEIERITPNRPMTHDLFRAFSVSFDIRIEEIVISDLKEGVFFARIICQNQDKRVEIDARPSDAIAIGIRFGVDIYTYEHILAEAGITLSHEEDEPGDEPEKAKEQKMGDLPFDRLKQMLDDALKNEDYEGAAKIRDELNRRN
jgi:uncharacterized protein